MTQRAAMTGYAESKRLPLAGPMVVLSGLWIIVGALFVLLGLWGDLGALMLFVFVLLTAVIFHQFWGEEDAGARMNEMNHFLKDVGLAGAALVLFGVYVRFGAELGLTLTDPLW